jgi:hypothetical protein
LDPGIDAKCTCSRRQANKRRREIRAEEPKKKRQERKYCIARNVGKMKLKMKPGYQRIHSLEMTWDLGPLEDGRPFFVTILDYERIVLDSIGYERPKKSRVIALVPKISVIRKGIFVRKVVVFMHVFALPNMYVFGIYVDPGREYILISIIYNVPEDVKFGIQDGGLCKRSRVIRCASDKGGSRDGGLCKRPRVIRCASDKGGSRDARL